MVQHGLQQCPARLYKYHPKQASSVILVVTVLLAVAMVQALFVSTDGLPPQHGTAVVIGAQSVEKVVPLTLTCLWCACACYHCTGVLLFPPILSPRGLTETDFAKMGPTTGSLSLSLPLSLSLSQCILISSFPHRRGLNVNKT